MAVIWGLDLHDIRWSKFKSSYMWNGDYHLRRTRFIVYQIAMILCIISESTGTAALDDYIRQQRFIEGRDRRASVHNDDLVGAGSFNIFVGVYVATIFGSAFFFDLFFPERRESKGVRKAWKICAILAIIFALGDAIALTIVVFTHAGHISGVDNFTASRLLRAYSDSTPLVYRRNARCVASAALIWPGWLATIASTVVMFASQRHDDEFGPWSKARKEELSVEKRQNSDPDTRTDGSKDGGLRQTDA